MSKYSLYVETLKEEVKNQVKKTVDEFNYSHVLKQAISYTVLNFGKMFRPTLLLSLLDDLSNSHELGLNMASAIEMIHAYGLIHDDLPALDDARFRRGRITNHLVYGEAQALLAGDALQAEAFKLAANTNSTSDVALNLVKLLARTSGVNGYVGGQSLDIYFENQDNEDISDEMLMKIHYGKTGALMEAAVLGAFYIAGLEENKKDDFISLAYELGLAYQIRDDIRDITKTNEELGKDVRSDLKKDKTTYPKLYGLSTAKVKFENHLNKALTLINNLLGEKSHTYTLVKEMLVL